MPTAGIISPALAHDPVNELLIYFLIGSCAQRRLAEEDICEVFPKAQEFGFPDEMSAVCSSSASRCTSVR
jgi:hypothetical protein